MKKRKVNVFSEFSIDIIRHFHEFGVQQPLAIYS